MRDRIYRVTDPGSAYKLCAVEYSDDDVTWRESKSTNTRIREHYRLHGTCPPGISSCQWPAVRKKLEAAA